LSQDQLLWHIVQWWTSYHCASFAIDPNSSTFWNLVAQADSDLSAKRLLQV
jgi:hypothetical protein